MGGYGIVVAIEPIGETTPEKAAAFRDAFWDALYELIRTACRRSANDVGLADYLWATAMNRWKEKSGWGASPRELRFSFMDGAGACPLGMRASLHWFEVSFARLRPQLDELAARHGFKLKAPRDPLDLVLSRPTAAPLVE